MPFMQASSAFLFCLMCTIPCRSAYAAEDVECLQAFKAAIDNDPYNYWNNWQGNPCSSQLTYCGVECAFSEQPHATAIHLPNRKLTESLRVDLAKCKYLKSLDVSNNTLLCGDWRLQNFTTIHHCANTGIGIPCPLYRLQDSNHLGTSVLQGSHRQLTQLVAPVLTPVIGALARTASPPPHLPIAPPLLARSLAPPPPSPSLPLPTNFPTFVPPPPPASPTSFPYPPSSPNPPSPSPPPSPLPLSPSLVSTVGGVLTPVLNPVTGPVSPVTAVVTPVIIPVVSTVANSTSPVTAVTSPVEGNAANTTSHVATVVTTSVTDTAATTSPVTAPVIAVVSPVVQAGSDITSAVISVVSPVAQAANETSIAAISVVSPAAQAAVTTLPLTSVTSPNLQVDVTAVAGAPMPVATAIAGTTSPIVAVVPIALQSVSNTTSPATDIFTPAPSPVTATASPEIQVVTGATSPVTDIVSPADQAVVNTTNPEVSVVPPEVQAVSAAASPVTAVITPGTSSVTAEATPVSTLITQVVPSVVTATPSPSTLPPPPISISAVVNPVISPVLAVVTPAASVTSLAAPVTSSVINNVASSPTPVTTPAAGTAAGVTSPVVGAATPVTSQAIGAVTNSTTGEVLPVTAMVTPGTGTTASPAAGAGAVVTPPFVQVAAPVSPSATSAGNSLTSPLTDLVVHVASPVSAFTSPLPPPPLTPDSPAVPELPPSPTSLSNVSDAIGGVVTPVTSSLPDTTPVVSSVANITVPAAAVLAPVTNPGTTVVNPVIPPVIGAINNITSSLAPVTTPVPGTIGNETTPVIGVLTPATSPVIGDATPAVTNESSPVTLLTTPVTSTIASPVAAVGNTFVSPTTTTLSPVMSPAGVIVSTVTTPTTGVVVGVVSPAVSYTASPPPHLLGPASNASPTDSARPPPPAVLGTLINLASPAVDIVVNSSAPAIGVLSPVTSPVLATVANLTSPTVVLLEPVLSPVVAAVTNSTPTVLQGAQPIAAPLASMPNSTGPELTPVALNVTTPDALAVSPVLNAQTGSPEVAPASISVGPFSPDGLPPADGLPASPDGSSIISSSAETPTPMIQVGTPRSIGASPGSPVAQAPKPATSSSTLEATSSSPSPPPGTVTISINTSASAAIPVDMFSPTLSPSDSPTVPSDTASPNALGVGSPTPTQSLGASPSATSNPTTAVSSPVVPELSPLNVAPTPSPLPLLPLLPPSPLPSAAVPADASLMPGSLQSNSWPAPQPLPSGVGASPSALPPEPLHSTSQPFQPPLGSSSSEQSPSGNPTSSGSSPELVPQSVAGPTPATAPAAAPAVSSTAAGPVNTVPSVPEPSPAPPSSSPLSAQPFTPPPPGTVNANTTGIRSPPNIGLNGPAVVVLQVGQTYVEQGAAANDAVDGMLWINVTSYYLDGRIVDTGHPTGTDPFIIVYTVTNSAGLTSTLIRTVKVADPCTAPLAYCNSTGGCGIGGVCLSVPGRIGANTAPRLTLDTTILGSTYELKYGTTYTACAAGTSPTLGRPCEPGCSADDQQNGNLTSKVVACPSPGCRDNSLLCSGQEFAKVGLQNCNVNSSLAVGSVIKVPFLVWDSGHPPLSATVYRTLVITAPCRTGQFYCFGTCSNVSCALAALVNQIYPPTLALSTPAFDLVGSKQVISVQYGLPLSLSLLPCSSLGEQKNCSTVAFDRQDGDISSSISVQSAASCQAEQNVACANCSIAQLQAGKCIPDKYVLSYAVIDSLGLSAMPLQITVIVYEAGAVQAQLQMISQTSNRALAHANTAQLTDISGSAANVAFRTAIASALTSWWANEGNASIAESAAISNFAKVDPFPFTTVQPTDVSVINSTFVANISDGTPGFFTYVSRAWVSIQANSSAFATSVSSSKASRRQLQESSASSVYFSALETKLDLLALSFYGASPCNYTAVSQAYYGGRVPVLSGDRPFYCISYTAGERDNIDAYLTSNTAVWASLPLFHILQISDGPTKVRYTSPVNADAILADSIQAESQQVAVSQFAMQQQVQCVNASLHVRLLLRELAAMVEASLAVEDQQTEAEVVHGIFEILLAANAPVPLTYDQLMVTLQHTRVSAQQSNLREEVVELRRMFFKLLEETLTSCDSVVCNRPRPHAHIYFTVATHANHAVLTIISDSVADANGPQPSVLLQINHNQSLEDQFSTMPAYAGSQASRRHLLSWGHSVANDQKHGNLQQQDSLPGHRSVLAGGLQDSGALDNATDALDNAAGTVENTVNLPVHVLHHRAPSTSAQNYSSKETGLWFGYNVSFIPRETLHEQYDLSHDDSKQTVAPGRWFGYDVHYRLKQSGKKHGKIIPRYFGGRNQVLGGLYFQQDRQTLTCRSKYQNLSTMCSETGRYSSTDLRNDVSNYSASAALYFMAHRTFAPLGHDPTFKTTSRLWNYDLIGKDGEYYNTSQEAGEVDASGHPRAFFQPVLKGLHSLKHYPILLTTQMSGHRARDALTYLQDGQYIDGDTRKVYLSMATYNSMRTTMSYISVTFSWIPSGSVQAALHINTMPTVPYVNIHEKAGFVVVDLVMMFLVAAFSISTMINLCCALFALPHSDKPTNIWACRAFLLFDCITCGIMLMSLVLYVGYAVLQCAVLQPEPYYRVYDSDNWAKARWYLLKRLGSNSGQMDYFTPGSDYAIFNSTTIANNPGGPNRWRLGLDPSGMLGYVELLEHLHVMMYLYYVLRILQLTTVALLLVRFWRKWEIQPRIAMVGWTLYSALPDLTWIGINVLIFLPILAVLLCLCETHHDDGFFTYRGAFDFLSKLLVLNNYGGRREKLHDDSDFGRLQSVVHDAYLWAGPLAYVIRTVLATFIIAAVLQPFRGQRRTALHAESARTAGLHNTLSQMFLDRWDKVFGQRLTTQQVIDFEKRLKLAPIKNVEFDATQVNTSSADKWLNSLHKSVSQKFADFSRRAARGLMVLLRSGRFTPDQARPDDPGKPTKGELAKAVRLLIANARDDEQLYHGLGRHWWDYSETCHEAFGRLLLSHDKTTAVLDTDQKHILELIGAAQPYFQNKDHKTSLSGEHGQQSIEDIYNRHRRSSLYAVANKARILALGVAKQQHAKRTQGLQVASTITSSILTSMANRSTRSSRAARRRSVIQSADARGPLGAVTKLYTYIAETPNGVKTDPNSTVLQRLRSTAGSTMLPQASLARGTSSLSAGFQLAGSRAGPPSIASLGTPADLRLQLNRLASIVAPGMARRSADLPLQQLMSEAASGNPRKRRDSAIIAPALARRAADLPLQQLLETQNNSTASSGRRTSAQGVSQNEEVLVPYAPRARRTSSMINPVLPTAASALSLVSQTIVEQGLFETAGSGVLGRSSSGMPKLARVSPTWSSSLYRLGSLAALTPAFLGIDAQPDTHRATEDLDDGVPLGGLAKLSSNVAGMVAGLEGAALSLRRISPAKPVHARAFTMEHSPRKVGTPKGSAGLQKAKGNSLAAALEQAHTEDSVGSAAGLQVSREAAGKFGVSLKRDARHWDSGVPHAMRHSVINRSGSQLMKKVSAKTALIQSTSLATSVVDDISSELSELSMQQAQIRQEMQDTMSSLQQLLDSIAV